MKVSVILAIISIILASFVLTRECKGGNLTRYEKENQQITITKSVAKKGQLTRVYRIITRDNRYNNTTTTQRYQINRRIRSGDLRGPNRRIRRIR